MMDGWKEVVFGDILAIPLRNGLTKPKAVRGTGCKLINMGELFALDRISTGVKMDLAPVTSSEKDNSSVKKGDLLFARQSLVLSGAGKCSIIADDCDDAVFESHLIRARPNPEIALGEFYYYYFSSYMGKKNIESIVEQVAAAGIRGSDLIKLKVPLPPLPEQRAIAATLSCLDDKIELNNKINANLETQAQAIFKSWFVDFEPFQDGEFVDSELGPIPKGWRVTLVGDICKSVSMKHNFKKDKLIFLNTGDIEDGQFLHRNYSKVEIMPGQAKKSIERHDILCSEIRPINRHFAYVNFDSSDYVVSTKLMVIRANGINGRRLYHYLTSPFVIQELQVEAESRSGTFPQIRFENVSNLRMVIADTYTEEKFCTLLEQIYGTIDSNNKENAVLSHLSDTLLPKLMSGEIEVPTAEATPS